MDSYNRKIIRTDTVLAEISEFKPQGKVCEWHVMLHPLEQISAFNEQLSVLIAGIREMDLSLHESAVLHFARCFVSDASNQQKAIRDSWEHTSETADVPLSIIQQSPLDGTKLAFWLYFAVPSHSPYVHYFDASCIAKETSAEGKSISSEAQTLSIFAQYQQDLEKRGCTIKDDCVRTWLFVRDVDVNYAGVVRGRTAFFRTQGMTADTHYIASTGIQGQTASSRELVTMDAYAIRGLQPGQMQYLYAPTHLNPTYEYNVTFERGTYIQYGDRRHLWISGTASINNKGMIVFPGDVLQQTKRMWENVEALLQEGGSSLDQICYLIVYLRDIADYKSVSLLFKKRFPDVPTVFLLAPVCRPGWLIEMECMAIAPIGSDIYPDF